MKRFYILAVAVLGGLTLSVGANAQQLQSPNSASKVVVNNKADKPSNLIITEKGDDVFSENFANGFDGNNQTGDGWTIEDTAGNTIWHYVDETGHTTYLDGEDVVYPDDWDLDQTPCAAAYPAGLGAGDPVVSPAGGCSSGSDDFAATSALVDGWMIFDGDFHNTPLSAGVEDVSGYLISPEIDMSELGSVILEYQQWFRYCCFGTSPLTVEVSTDGFATWTSFAGHGTFVQAANVASGNALTTQIDISCAAAGESAVQYRFAYNSDQATGYSHYFWALDDVRIFEVPFLDNLEIVELNNGDIFNFYEYRITPLSQVPADGVLSGTIYKNGGQLNQDNTTITIEILDDANTVVSTTVSEPFSIVSYANSTICPQDDNDTLMMSTGWTPAETGTYTMRATIASADATDETPENNVMEKTIVFTMDEFGHDDPDNWDEEAGPGLADDPGVFDPTGYGNVFEFENDDPNETAWGLLVAFGDASGEGANFDARFGEIEPDADDVYDINATLNDLLENQFTMTSDMISASIDDPTWTYLSFDDQFDEIESGNRYYAYVISEDDQELEVTVYANSNSDTDFSSGDFSQAGDGSFIWFLNDTSTPAVRLILSSQYESVNELAELNDFKVGQNVPNPASNDSFIPYRLDRAMDVSFTFSDVTGKIVKTINLGTQPAGSSSVTFDASEFAAGVYTFSMIADGVRVTKKMIVE